ncbi:hypothetical protein PVAND_005690 [Polypedilum vanderplanki]|uniref:Alpha 1,4-glycosyltransferase domain-containing protein n=1 Tax=Polypedilum vanderplanki TaxID=319348 RepID=A0A9J6C1Y5_POLVA|nr:hypothetical protein PVAND_005690 [Polypedilum vanderplanki]
MNLRYINSNIIRKRIFLFLVIIVLLIIFVYSVRNDAKNCFLNYTWTDGKTLQDVSKNIHLKTHSSSKNIFFHETSCSNDGIIKINSRQACAIESAARMNPDYNIYLLFTSQVGYRNETPLPLVDTLLSYHNVHFNYLNITRYAESTPLADWIKNGDLFRSSYVTSHTSDVLRYLSLWKYGGTYMDLDIVMLDKLSKQKPNYAGAESNKFVAVGIINFEGESGHEIADMCLRDLLKNFNGEDWGNNGPGVLTRVLQKICGTKDVMKMMIDGVCKNFNVLPIEKCYSIRWPEHRKFFEEAFLNETLERLSDSLIAHVWNKHSAATVLTKESNVAYIHLAKKYCPKTLSASEFF